jgi:hypothetical protein
LRLIDHLVTNYDRENCACRVLGAGASAALARFHGLSKARLRKDGALQKESAGRSDYDGAADPICTGRYNVALLLLPPRFWGFPMPLFPVVQEGKWGFIREDGSIAVPPQFESAMMCSEGLAGFKRGGKWGFMSEAGDIAIKPRFTSCRPFSSGLALVEEGESKLYVDPAGKVVIRANFYECRSFQDDLAWVVPEMTSPAVFIDRTGKVVLSGRKFHVSQYACGLINCKEGKQWGFINRGGEFVIEPRYRHAHPFGEGLAAVAIRNQKDFCFIDVNGKVVIDGKFHGSDIGFSGDRCAVWNKHYGYIDRSGTLVIPYRFYYADHFSEGRAVVQEPDSDHYGFIDEAGEMVIRPTFFHASAFSGGLAHVTVGKDFASCRYGYIDRRGEYVWEPSR